MYTTQGFFLLLKKYFSIRVVFLVRLINMRFVIKDKTNWKLLIIVVLIVAAVWGIPWILEKRNSPSQWQTYYDAESNLSVRYPSSWTAQKQVPSGSAEYKIIALEGKEGSILIYFGSGFGGGCNEQQYTKIIVGNESLTACRSVLDDGSEQWRNFSFKKNGIDFTGVVTIRPPFQNNSKTVLTILSTIFP